MTDKEISQIPFAKLLRLIWIDWQLEIGGLNRQMICDAFNISQQQASNDISTFQKHWPGKAEYDHRAKEYLRPRRAGAAFPWHLRHYVWIVSSAVQAFRHRSTPPLSATLPAKSPDGERLPSREGDL